MNIHWFGSPWPSEQKRAPICENDDDQLPVDTVLEKRCVECGKLFTEKDHGVVTQCVGNVWHHFWIDINGDNTCVCAYHLRCWLTEVVGGVMSEKVLSRMTGEGFAHIAQNMPLQHLFVDSTYQNDPNAPEEDAEIGKGWNRTGI